MKFHCSSVRQLAQDELRSLPDRASCAKNHNLNLPRSLEIGISATAGLVCGQKPLEPPMRSSRLKQVKRSLCLGGAILGGASLAMAQDSTGLDKLEQQNKELKARLDAL